MKIKKIQKLNSGKYKIEFENGDKLSTYDDVILKNQLLFHKEVDYNTFVQLSKDTDYFNLYNKMLKKISTKLRSEKEIRQELEKLTTKEEQSSIIHKLKEAGFLNDLAFAKAYVSDKVHLSNEGPYKIRKGLEEHKIEEEWIEEAMATIEETVIEEKLKKLIMKKIHANHKHSNYMLKQKLLMEFSVNGYDKEMIRSIFDESCVNTENILEREAERVYQRLSKKYQGKELGQKLKEKLYQKGFTMIDIHKILEEKGL